jgi:hypothetical protein
MEATTAHTPIDVIRFLIPENPSLGRKRRPADLPTIGKIEQPLQTGSVGRGRVAFGRSPPPKRPGRLAQPSLWKRTWYVRPLRPSLPGLMESDQGEADLCVKDSGLLRARLTIRLHISMSLRQIMDWLRSGGLRRNARPHSEERRQRERLQAPVYPHPTDNDPPVGTAGRPLSRQTDSGGFPP